MNDWDEWCKKTFPLDFKCVAKMQETGFIYITKRDRDYRPTIVLECAKLLNCITEFNEKEIADCVTYACSYAIDNLLLSGKVETLNVICDLTGVSAFNAPTTLIQNVVLTLINGYPTRINRNFIIGLDIVLRTTYNVMYYFIPEFTRNALVVVGYWELKEVMGQWYDLEDLPEQYGGTGPKISGDYYPPNMTQHNQTMLTQDEATDLSAELLLNPPVSEEWY